MAVITMEGTVSRLSLKGIIPMIQVKAEAKIKVEVKAEVKAEVKVKGFST